MSRKTYRTSIPVSAVEIIQSRHSNGITKSACYLVAGVKVGERAWLENGNLDFEYAYQNGARHGRTFFFYPTGEPEEVQPYRHGLMHGIGKQWSPDGRVLVTWIFAGGVGLDLWCDWTTERLAEEGYWPRDGENGYSRQWNRDEKTIWEEYYFRRGAGYHGVWREWNVKGRLRRGFPKFYVSDLKVTKRHYLAACKTDLTLPPYRAKDDHPRRKLPVEYTRQRQSRGKRKRSP